MKPLIVKMMINISILWCYCFFIGSHKKDWETHGLHDKIYLFEISYRQLCLNTAR